MLATLLALALATDAPTLVSFEGKKLELALEARHRLRLPRVLPDVQVPEGRHRFSESKPVRDPSPMLAVAGETLDGRSGDVFVVGKSPVVVEGRLWLSFFAFEPFPGAAFPAQRLRTVAMDGSPTLVTQTLEVLQLEPDENFLWVVGLDPTARYRLEVTEGEAQSVLVAGDLNLQVADALRPADASWQASRWVLHTAEKAVFGGVDRLALTIAGTTRATGKQVRLTLTETRRGKRPRPRPFSVGTRWRQFTHAVLKALLERRDVGSLKLMAEQCLALDADDLGCRLRLGQSLAGMGEGRRSRGILCRIIGMAPETEEAAEARRFVGQKGCD